MNRFLVFSAYTIIFFISLSVNVSFAIESDTLGVQKTAVILINETDADSAGLMTPAEIKQAVFDGEYSLNSFYKENSYNQISFTGEVFGWFDLSDLQSECVLNGEKLFQILDGKVDYQKFSRFIVFYSLNTKVCEGRGLGESTHGKEEYQTPRGKVRASISNIGIDHRLSKPAFPFQPLSGLNSGVMTHEMGHGLGIFGHSNILHCGTKTFSASAGECVQSGIADMTAIMGGEGFFRPALHMNACHKQDLGWLAAPQLKTISIKEIRAQKKDGVEFDIFPYENRIGESILSIRIDLEKNISVTNGVEISSLFFEYKTATGMNRRLSQLATDAGTLYRNIKFVGSDYVNGSTRIDIDGLQIHGGMFKNGHCVTTYLFDAKPGSIQWDDQRYDLYDALDGFLTIGKSVIEPMNNIEITAIQKNKNGSIRLRLKAK